MGVGLRRHFCLPRYGGIFRARIGYSDHRLTLANHFQKHLVRDVYPPPREHLFLAFLLLFTELHLARDVAAIHMLHDVFLHR